MPKGGKFDRCVKHVEQGNKGKPRNKRVNPHAACHASLGKKKPQGGKKK